MMTKNQKRILVVAAIVLVVFSVIAFAVPFKKNGVFWLAYLFGVIAIATHLYILKTAFSGTESVKSKFYGFPIAQVGFIYMAAQLVLSIVFMALAPIASIWLAVVLFVLAFGACAIGFISADAVRDEIERQDVRLEIDTSCMMSLRSIVYPLAGQCTAEKDRKALTELADAFRYSDPVSNAATKTIEAELEEAVADLQRSINEGNGQTITAACKNIATLLEERNHICRLNKRK